MAASGYRVPAQDLRPPGSLVHRATPTASSSSAVDPSCCVRRRKRFSPGRQGPATAFVPFKRRYLDVHSLFRWRPRRRHTHTAFREGLTLHRSRLIATVIDYARHASGAHVLDPDSISPCSTAPDASPVPTPPERSSKRKGGKYADPLRATCLTGLWITCTTSVQV